MKIILLILFVVILQDAQAQNHLITNQSIGNINVNMRIPDVIKLYPKYEKIGEIAEEESENYGIFYLLKDQKTGKVLITVNSLDGKTISSISTTNSLFKTERGISVGMTLGDIIKNYKQVKLGAALDYGEGYANQDLTVSTTLAPQINFDLKATKELIKKAEFKGGRLVPNDIPLSTLIEHIVINSGSL